MNAHKYIFAIGMVFSMILAACSPNSTSTNPLEDTSWILTKLNGQPVNSDAQVTINFTNDKVDGTDGCNNYSGSYEVKGNKISFNEDMVSTMMACEEAVMQQAAAYISALIQAETYKIEGQQLTLLDKNGKELAVFTAQATGLGGSSWVVTGYNNGKQAVVSGILGSELTANFNEDGKLSGFAGCNNFTAGYEVTGKNIKIGPAASTRKMCADPEGVMDQEMQYLQALETAAIYNRDGEKLELRTADGALAVSLVSSGEVDTAQEQVSQAGASFLQALPNAEYPLEDIGSGTVLLQNGTFEEPAAPGSAVTTRVQLGDVQAVGDVNGDEVDDAAVLLVVDPGGSGTFTYLGLVINENGNAKPIGSVFLGDRIIIKSLAIDSGNVVVTMLDRKPDEPMSAEPTQEVIRTFKLLGDNFVEVE